jgi:electron transfer flavoprotein beta subunit
MNIVVCVKRVPDTAEEELAVSKDGKGIVDRDLSFACNESDLYAVEAALLIKEKDGGEVVLVTVGPEDSEEILRMELAKGADRAVHVIVEDKVLDAHAVAATLAAAIRGLTYDLILAGSWASDTGGAQVGGTLAEMRGIPHASLVTSLEVDQNKVRVGRELEGGQIERLEIDLPEVLLVQTGLNKPRYASILGIRKAGAKEIREVELDELEGAPGERIRTTIGQLSLPPKGKMAEIIPGTPEVAGGSLALALKAKGLM